MATCPYDVNLAARYVFAGGRFEQFLTGHAQGAVYEYDINSAYPFYATQLPNLARGRWRRGREYEPGKFALYHIYYHAARPDCERMYPLFRRMADQSVCWPYRVEGWYHAPEAELVKDDPDARFIESWVFDEDDPTDRPFSFLADYYHNRKAADKAGSVAAYTFKILINAIYGQLAQRSGWDRKKRKAPRSHQLEWAGYITSGCRAAVYRAAVQAGEKLVSINTDSVQTLAPLHLDTGPSLGQWKDSEWQDGIFWQSGIYALRESLGYDDSLGYGWDKAKTRGIPRGAYSVDDLLECLRTGEPLRLDKKVFVTYGLADNGRMDKLNTWVTEPHEFVMGGSGKRQHYAGPKGVYCKNHCDHLHRLTMLNLQWSPEGECMSVRHWLPWLDPPDRDKQVMSDLMLFDLDNLDDDDDWMIGLRA